MTMLVAPYSRRQAFPRQWSIVVEEMRKVAPAAVKHCVSPGPPQAKDELMAVDVPTRNPLGRMTTIAWLGSPVESYPK